MIGGMLALAATDVFLAWLAVHSRQRKDEPLSMSATYSGVVASLGVHCLGSLPLLWSLNMGSRSGRATFVTTFFFFGLIPAVVYIRLILESSSTGIAEMFFSMKTARPCKTDFSKAWARAARGDEKGALVEFRKHVAENPDDPEPLFEMAKFFEKEGRYEGAAAAFRTVIQRFKDNDAAWEKAAFFLGDVLERKLGDKDTAAYLYKEILRRAAQDSHYAGYARSRLYPSR